jgi:succinate dehydrogenase/fumarate reductase flavoprotein subunit
MMPIEIPPYYCIEAWPIITNTQGGPVHNTRQQIVDPYGDAIPRLYGAGEMGSMFGHLYLLAGNNAECFIGGEIAGRNAAAEAPWTE